MTEKGERRKSNMVSSPSSVSGQAESNKDSKGLKFSELHEVCACGDGDKLEEMLKAGRFEYLNYKDPDWGDRTPLHWCSMKGKGDMVRRLIDKGAHPGLRSSCGWTAAHFAAEGGKTNVLRTLHSMDSPMDRRDLYGDTPRKIAEIYGFKESVEFLRIAEEEYRDKRTNTELIGEAQPFDDEDMEWCLRNNFEPDKYTSADDISSASLSLKSFAESVASSKKRKPRHYGKNTSTSSTSIQSKKSPKTARKKSGESSPKQEKNITGKKTSKVSNQKKNAVTKKRKSSLDRISETKTASTK